ncbi:hypothetical protein HOY80DRAFT_1004413 [Tuber brumale]|nr:hypothetical protein HOY80DRAFT_1004413 [Tuber brumale]
MSSNRSIARREVFVPTPFVIWEDEPRSPPPPRPQSRPEDRRIISLFIPPLIRPSTPVSRRSSSPALLATGSTDGVDPVKRDPPTQGSEREMKIEAPKEGEKRGIAKLLGRVKGAFHKLLKGMKHE